MLHVRGTVLGTDFARHVVEAVEAQDEGEVFPGICRTGSRALAEGYSLIHHPAEQLALLTACSGEVNDLDSFQERHGGLYAFLSQIFDYGNTDIEKRFLFMCMKDVLKIGIECHVNLCPCRDHNANFGIQDFPILSPSFNGMVFCCERVKGNWALLAL